MNAKIPVHIIRFEDILANPKITMTKLFKFILNEPNIEGTIIEQYINLVVKDQAPQIYKPREGKSHLNYDKFTRDQLDFMFNYAKDLITNLGYDEHFTGLPSKIQTTFIDNYNKESLEKSIS